MNTTLLFAMQGHLILRRELQGRQCQKGRLKFGSLIIISAYIDSSTTDQAQERIRGEEALGRRHHGKARRVRDGREARMAR